MKILTLIKALQRIYDVHGNIEVLVPVDIFGYIRIHEGRLRISNFRSTQRGGYDDVGKDTENSFPAVVI